MSGGRVAPSRNRTTTFRPPCLLDPTAEFRESHLWLLPIGRSHICCSERAMTSLANGWPGHLQIHRPPLFTTCDSSGALLIDKNHIEGSRIDPWRLARIYMQSCTEGKGKHAT